MRNRITCLLDLLAPRCSDPTLNRSFPLAGTSLLGGEAAPSDLFPAQVLEELKNVFTPELAYLSYVPLCRFLGARYMEDALPNHDLLRSLCLQHDENNQADYAAGTSQRLSGRNKLVGVFEGRCSLILLGVLPSWKLRKLGFVLNGGKFFFWRGIGCDCGVSRVDRV